jgi:hypothetical protein
MTMDTDRVDTNSALIGTFLNLVTPPISEVFSRGNEVKPSILKRATTRRLKQINEGDITLAILPY